MAHEHPSGLEGAYDRAPENPDWARVIVREDRIAQATELNEIQTITERRGRRVGDMTAKDGDRIEGAGAVVIYDSEEEGEAAVTGSISLSAGKIYIAGDVRPVEAAVLPISMVGNFTVGVRLDVITVTEEDDETLLGLHPGTEAEGEPGAARVIETISWALPDDGGDGEFFAVYRLLEGAIVDQAPPPVLTGVGQQIAVYDYDANGHYIVDGCRVEALGKTGSSQVFSIGAGTANIRGFKRIREAALRHTELETPDLEVVTAEPHTFTGPTNGSTVVTVSRGPISAVSSVVVVKRTTQTVVRGTTPGGMDELQFSSIVEIESVTQSSTTFPTNTYALSGDNISWAPGGSEPAASSSYQVTYLYNASVTPTAITETTLTVAGGVNGKPVLVTYTSKVPRVDILCLDVNGLPIYVKGISARQNIMAPLPPTSLLKLAEIWNDWIGKPQIKNNGTFNYDYDTQRRYFERLITVLDQFDRSEAERDILARAPVAKSGIFTDTFVDDFYRDQGEAQTAAINQGALQLAIDEVLLQVVGDDFYTLPYVEEILIRQDLRTASLEINPYDNFVQMPGRMTLEPPVDFWNEAATDWTSDITREFSAAPNVPPGTTVINEVTEMRREVARFLRQIPVTMKIEGFGAGENLKTLTMDTVNIKPAGTQTADGQGMITLTATIPPDMPVGSRLVRAEGMAGSFAEAIFVGEGTIDVTTMRRVNLVTQAAPEPVIINNITNVRNVTKRVTQNITQVTQINQTIIQQRIDPLAQTFALPEGRFVLGINFRFTAIGNRANGVRVQMSTVLNGYPTAEVLAEDFISMATPQVGDLIEARFRAPVWVPNDREFCFVILTSDPTHAVAISRLGDVDPITQTRISSQPYTVGVMFSSANRVTWTPHQEADIHFQIVGAKFTSTSRTVNLWTGLLDDISDLIVRGVVEIPTEEARFRYEIVRANGDIISMMPNQNLEFDEYLNETVTLRAVLTGSELVSPLLYPNSALIGGSIRNSGTYVSRAFPMGSAVEVASIFAAFLPAGGSIAVHVDAVDDNWQPLTIDTTDVLGGGWTEPRYERPSFTAAMGRVRITLNGGPGARTSAARLRAYSL